MPRTLSEDCSESPFEPVQFNEKYVREVDWTVAAPLVCPKCGCDYNHPHSTAVNRAGRLTVIRGDDDATNCASLPVGRGSTVLIELVCENNHLWHLRFQFHKGQTYADQGVDGEVTVDAWPRGFWRD